MTFALSAPPVFTPQSFVDSLAGGFETMFRLRPGEAEYSSGSREPHAPRWDLYRPPEFEPWKQLDAERWRRGEPNVFDIERAAPPSAGGRGPSV
jgi:hypothetical protein